MKTLDLIRALGLSETDREVFRILSEGVAEELAELEEDIEERIDASHEEGEEWGREWGRERGFEEGIEEGIRQAQEEMNEDKSLRGTLRINDEKVKTVTGENIAVKDFAQAYEDFRNGEDTVEGYRIQPGKSDKFVRIGCQAVRRSEIERIATELGVRFTPSFKEGGGI